MIPNSMFVSLNAHPVFTVGHSNHALEHLLGLLADNRIALVVDVRSRPASGRFPHFNKRSLSEALGRAGIDYRFLGDRLGGMPDDPRFYDDQGHVLYGVIAATPGFGRGVEEIVQAAGRVRIALMCGEEYPTGCHRRLLVGRVLREHGLQVRHIRGDGRVLDESELGGPDQLTLFGQPDKAWRSVRPVRRR